MKKKIKSCILILLALTLCLSMLPVSVLADDGKKEKKEAKQADASGIMEVKEFEDIKKGDGKFLKKYYRENYALDMEDAGMDVVKSALNGINNAIFKLDTMLTYITCVVFYHCFSFDISSVLGSEINGIQKSLKKGIFDSLFALGAAMTFLSIIMHFKNGNLQKMGGQFCAMLFVMVLAVLLTTQSTGLLSETNRITKGVASQVMGGINGVKTTDDADAGVNKFAAEASSVLWSTLHKPWLALEFNGYHPKEKQVKEILALPVGSKDREKKVKEMKKAHDDKIFAKEAEPGRFGMLLVYTIVILVKCALFMAMGVIMMGFQLIALLFLLMAPLVLTMALFPQLGGLERITQLGKHILESQLSIIIITFIIGLVVKFDSWALKQTAYGWFLGMLFQVFVCVLMFLNREKVLRAISVGVTMKDPVRAVQELGSGMRLAPAGHGRGRPDIERQYRQQEIRRRERQEKRSSGGGVIRQPLLKRAALRAANVADFKNQVQDKVGNFTERAAHAPERMKYNLMDKKEEFKKEMKGNMDGAQRLRDKKNEAYHRDFERQRKQYGKKPDEAEQKREYQRNNAAAQYPRTDAEMNGADLDVSPAYNTSPDVSGSTEMSYVRQKLRPGSAVRKQKREDDSQEQNKFRHVSTVAVTRRPARQDRVPRPETALKLS